jgi:predicted nucleotidyltransferase component of viral defense system
MNSHSNYYEERLYPLQDGVLNCVAGCGTDFFLTGGTALNRFHKPVRYSDDLDFFIQSEADFTDQVDSILDALRITGFLIDLSAESIRTGDFCTLIVFHPDDPAVKLKLDFVKDIPVHYGAFLLKDKAPRIDSPRNILSNKITALFRFEAKDVADIHTLCSFMCFNWQEILAEARQKEAGVEAPLAAEILTGMPEDDFNAING